MAITQLALYNIALAAIGERSISALTEDREPRRLLDEIWTRGNGAERACLEQGLWNHAIRAVQMDKSTSVTPSFGFSYAFDKPSDFVRLVQLSANETFSDPLVNYEIEAAYFYSDVDPMYMRYVSDHANYGKDLSLWPESFSLWVGHWLATQIAPRFKNDIDMEKLEKREHKLLVGARSKDAQQEPVRFPPMGSWNRARLGGRGGDRGKRSQFTG